MSATKPYEILIRSPKGCIFDKLLCIKCCDTVLRGNYTAHKKTKKHIQLHTNEDEKEDAETFKKRQLIKVKEYYNDKQLI